MSLSDPDVKTPDSFFVLWNIVRSLLAATLIAAVLVLLSRRARPPQPRESSNEMSRFVGGSKKADTAMIADFRSITGASQADAQKFCKKHKTLEGAIDAFYNDPVAQGNAQSSSADKSREKKLGEIWEKFKDPSDPKLITIEGTMEWCGELDINPESDPVLFCLAHDLGSKATGEWEKGPFVAGWMAMPGVDSLASMKAQLSQLRTKLNSDPVYFKKVYMHTFDLAKEPGSRVLKLDTAIDLWTLYIPPALSHRPSALSRIPPGDLPTSPSTATPPAFSQADFDEWITFQRNKGKAVSKDTWSLFVDFVRSIDVDFKEYDDEAAWPSTIDDFVDHVRSKRGGK